ncbi:hypothetical protein [Wolbachia endosymbiont of Folsomia candida]|uniref:hypothetical protein n=1 Tax=Wolbachia endosymbiont of Folsomia candida TaxID=169402 RepID=UPI000B29D949|nr:hypothetical protein [Wolbachia endosymbiont of Folsomia candida]APR97940.1 hypothetical protein ASM33_01250 [Wolbachia endosymbiont of Folsomia candida]
MSTRAKYEFTLNQLLYKMHFFIKTYRENERKNNISEELESEFYRVNEMWHVDVAKAIEARRSSSKKEVKESTMVSLLQDVIANMDEFIQKYGVASESKELAKTKRADHPEDFVLLDEYHSYEQDYYLI